MKLIDIKIRKPEYNEFILFVVQEDQGPFDNKLYTYRLGWLNSSESLNSENDEWFSDSSGEWIDFNKVTHWIKLPMLIEK